MIAEKPYFMQNPEWFYYDDKEKVYKLTDKAPEKARKSYEDFYTIIEGDRFIDR